MQVYYKHITLPVCHFVVLQLLKLICLSTPLYHLSLERDHHRTMAEQMVHWSYQDPLTINQNQHQWIFMDSWGTGMAWVTLDTIVSHLVWLKWPCSLCIYIGRHFFPPHITQIYTTTLSWFKGTVGCHGFLGISWLVQWLSSHAWLLFLADNMFSSIH